MNTVLSTSLGTVKGEKSMVSRFKEFRIYWELLDPKQ